MNMQAEEYLDDIVEGATRALDGWTPAEVATELSLPEEVVEYLKIHEAYFHIEVRFNIVSETQSGYDIIRKEG